MADEQTIAELEAACTDKEVLFAYAYATCGNATKAAELAGYAATSYDSLRQLGSVVSRRPHVRALIDALLAAQKIAVTEDRIVAALAEIAFECSLEDFITPNKRGAGYRIDVKKAIQHNKMHLVKSLSKGPKGERIELPDRLTALTTLAKIKGMFIERVEVTGQNGTPLFPIPDLVAALRQAETELSNDAG